MTILTKYSSISRRSPAPRQSRNKTSVRFQLIYRTVIISAILLFGSLVSRKYVWIIGVSIGILSAPIGKVVQKLKYSALLRKIKAKEIK